MTNLFVLIMIFSGPYVTDNKHSSTITVEFNTLEQCENARKSIVKTLSTYSPSINVMAQGCFFKGRPENSTTAKP